MYPQNVMPQSQYSWSAIITVPLIIAASVVLNSFVLMMLWEWFLVPVAPVEELSFVGAIGLFLLLGLVLGSAEVIDMDANLDGEAVAVLMKKAIYADIKSLGFLIVGWLIHLLM